MVDVVRSMVNIVQYFYVDCTNARCILFELNAILVEKNMIAIRAAVIIVIVVVATAVESRINSPLSVIITPNTIN
jgi:hypothetical protein